MLTAPTAAAVVVSISARYHTYESQQVKTHSGSTNEPSLNDQESPVKRRAGKATKDFHAGSHSKAFAMKSFVTPIVHTS